MEEDAMTRRMKKRITEEKECTIEFEKGCGYVEFDSLAEYICIGRLVATTLTAPNGLR